MKKKGWVWSLKAVNVYPCAITLDQAQFCFVIAFSSCFNRVPLQSILKAAHFTLQRGSQILSLCSKPLKHFPFHSRWKPEALQQLTSPKSSDVHPVPSLTFILPFAYSPQPLKPLCCSQTGKWTPASAPLFLPGLLTLPASTFPAAHPLKAHLSRKLLPDRLLIFALSSSHHTLFFLLTHYVYLLIYCSYYLFSFSGI